MGVVTLTPQQDEQVQRQTQDEIKMQLGDLILNLARAKAERDVLAAELARVQATPEPPRDTV